MYGIVTVGVHNEAILGIYEACLESGRSQIGTGCQSTHVPCSIHDDFHRSSSLDGGCFGGSELALEAVKS